MNYYMVNEISLHGILGLKIKNKRYSYNELLTDKQVMRLGLTVDEINTYFFYMSTPKSNTYYRNGSRFRIDTNLVDGINGKWLIDSLNKDITKLETKHALSTGREAYTIGNLIRFKQQFL